MHQTGSHGSFEILGVHEIRAWSARVPLPQIFHIIKYSSRLSVNCAPAIDLKLKDYLTELSTKVQQILPLLEKVFHLFIFSFFMFRSSQFGTNSYQNIKY